MSFIVSFSFFSQNYDEPSKRLLKLWLLVIHVWMFLFLRFGSISPRFLLSFLFEDICSFPWSSEVDKMEVILTFLLMSFVRYWFLFVLFPKLWWWHCKVDEYFMIASYPCLINTILRGLNIIFPMFLFWFETFVSMDLFMMIKWKWLVTILRIPILMSFVLYCINFIPFSKLWSTYKIFDCIVITSYPCLNIFILSGLVILLQGSSFISCLKTLTRNSIFWCW